MAQTGYRASEPVPGSVVRGLGADGAEMRGEAVTVRRCVDVGGPATSAPLPSRSEPRSLPPVALSEPTMGRIIPMPCVVAGSAPASSARPLAADGGAPASTVRLMAREPSLPSRVEPEASVEPAVEPLPQSAVDVMAETEREVSFVSARLVITAPARRARPEPELPVVMVRPSLVLPPEQLAHVDRNALLMLTPPDVTDFCVPERAVKPSAPTMPPLTTRTVPLSVLSARTMQVPVLEPTARREPARAFVALGWLVLLALAFAAGLLATTAIVVHMIPTSCR